MTTGIYLGMPYLVQFVLLSEGLEQARCQSPPQSPAAEAPVRPLQVHDGVLFDSRAEDETTTTTTYHSFTNNSLNKTQHECVVSVSSPVALSSLVVDHGQADPYLRRVAERTVRLRTHRAVVWPAVWPPVLRLHGHSGLGAASGDAEKLRDRDNQRNYIKIIEHRQE
jgi:hypothetical protein